MTYNWLDTVVLETRRSFTMDPITTVGFASSILTFIDFSQQLISGTFEVIKLGSTSENVHVSVVIDDLRDATKELSNRPLGLSRHEYALQTLASECQELSEDLQKLLEKLMVTAESSKWKSAKIALRSTWKKEEVAELQNRLDKYRSQILLRLVLILKYAITNPSSISSTVTNDDISERQLLVQIQLSTLQSESQKNGRGAVEQLTSLRNQVLDAVEKTISQNEKLESSQDQSEQLQLIKEVRTTLDTLIESFAPPTPEMRILRQIYFRSIYSREDAMEKAHNGTFEWILREESTIAGKDSDSEETEDEETEEDEDSDTESGKHSEEIRCLYCQTRSTFLSWLRTGNHVFHISGKAGSGKSTLMKLLLDHPRTREELNYWAADKRLVFAHFFFWQSRDKLQRSLEGLYRSILFETLKQCPDLTQEVFPEAYDTFSTVRQENCIDELFFRPEDFGKGLQRLVSSSLNHGYRFCFFIDGLDKYGEKGDDRLHHEALAKDLEMWASKENIKILVSSRPHMEFQSAFSDDLRIKLHDLTKPDISRFGRRMFKNDKNFPHVQHCYKDLVDKVVEYSDGVFLWARLAIRSLLMAVRRREAIDSLENQLDNIPKDINDLYEKLLASINAKERVKTFKMLVLADKSEEGLTAVALTWIDNLDDPKFPTSYNMQPYTDDEIKERQLAAELQLDYFTRGLLEISTVDDSRNKQDLFSMKRVQFFHRTLRDFVSQSKELRQFSVDFPGFMSRETQAQIHLGALWFVKPEHANEGFSIHNLFSCWPSGESRDTWLNAYERVLNYHHQAGATDLTGIARFPAGKGMIFGAHTQKSYFHWVTWHLSDLDYTRRRLSKIPNLLHSREDLSLLLSVAFSSEYTLNLKDLLELGACPNEQIKVKHIRTYRDEEGREVYYKRNTANITEFRTSTTTFWRVFCASFSFKMICRQRERYKIRYCRMLADLLATAQVDANCFILLGLGKRRREYTEEPTHVISLRELVQQLDLPNWKTLQKLLDPGLGIFATLQNSWRHLTSFKSEQSLRPDEYLPFNLNMLPPILDGLEHENSYDDYGFFVHSVRWRDAQLMVPYLRVRIC